MVEDASIQRKAIGNACRNLHREKYQVAPRFLRRNIRHILDSHAKALQQTSGATPHEDMVANAKRDWGWDFPTTDMLKDFMNGNRPILQIKSLQLQNPGSKSKFQRRAPQRIDSADDLRWLPDPQNDAIWPCTVSISLSKSPNPNRSLRRESTSAKILQSQNNGRSEFNVELHRPFFIELKDLFVVTESGKNGGRSWKKTMTTPYLLEISIQCQDSDDSAEFLGRLESKDASAYQNTPGNEGILKATWEQLPTCPPDDELLVIKRAHGHKSLELAYKLHVAMGWISRRDYRLRSYDKVFESKGEEVRQLPTPSASDDMEKVVKRYCIIYKFRDSSATRTLVARSLACPFCPEGKDYVYFERLMLHCKTHHSHFDFAPIYDTEKSDGSNLNATILMSIPSHGLDKQEDEDEQEINWIAPHRPFNIKAHIRGEDDWAGQVRTKSRKGASKHSKDKIPHAAPVALPSRKRSAPDEIEDLPEHRPKRHCVPYVPGVSFYRTTSKQEIQAGELVMESDDEVDDTWLAQSQDQALEELGLGGAAKDFTSAFNQHLASEQSDSSVLVRDALVRFTRSHINQLTHVEWQRQFRAKLNQLRCAGIIGDDIVSACVNLILEARDKKVNGDISKAASAGAEKDSRRHPVGTAEYEKQANGTHVKSRQSNGETTNNTTSTSEDDRLKPKGGTNPSASKTAMISKAIANGRTSHKATDQGTDREMSLNEDNTADQPRDSNDLGTGVAKGICLCGTSAVASRRDVIACHHPVSHCLE